jgi:uncharacterized SAM-binding protein YcdF (DUF218 family)
MTRASATSRRASPRRAGRLRVAAAVLLSAAALWLAGLIWFAEQIPRSSGTDPGPTDAIVVLTGGSERIVTGVGLLDRGVARKLLVSGVHQGVDRNDLLRLLELPPGHLECCIVLGYAAGDTIGNAAETAAWMRAEGYRSLRLVTANYHMRRSLLEFQMTMPDIRIVPHPVVPDTVRLDGWWQWRGTATLIVGEYNKFLVTSARYWLLRIFGMAGIA